MSLHLENSAERRGPGRPREFDVEAALDGAIQVYRARGYHAASIGELRTAMGLTTGSIYKAFSDKRAIFLAAFDRYVQLRHRRLQSLVDAQSSGLEKIRVLLAFYAEASHGREGKQGCLVVGSATELAILDPEMAHRVKAALRRLEALLHRLISLGQKDRSISARIDGKATARTLLCLLQGLRIIGKTGRTKAEMMAAMEPALQLLTRTRPSVRGGPASVHNP